jgi:hypothetical protein
VGVLDEWAGGDGVTIFVCEGYGPFVKRGPHDEGSADPHFDWEWDRNKDGWDEGEERGEMKKVGDLGKVIGEEGRGLLKVVVVGRYEGRDCGIDGKELLGEQ